MGEPAAGNLVCRNARKIIALLASLGLLFGVGSSSTNAQSAEPIATLSRAASVPVRVQPDVATDGLLRLWIRAYTPPPRGAVEVAVSLARGNKEAAVDRFAIFPDQAFQAASTAQERGYMFDGREALNSLAGAVGELTARVRLLPIEPGETPAGASLTVARAELVSR
jgi:hypothetical protein